MRESEGGEKMAFLVFCRFVEGSSFTDICWRSYKHGDGGYELLLMNDGVRFGIMWIEG